MDVESAIRAFASAGHDLPKSAMRWTLDHWDEAAPRLLAMLERFAGGADRSEDAAAALFYILHLAGEKRETRAFAPLCRLAQDSEALEQALGDGIASTLTPILISTYDGDLATLKSVIEAPAAEDVVRYAALEALAYLTATGRIARDETEAYLRRLHETMQPQSEDFAWFGWAMAVALLGMEGLSDLVRDAFGRGLIGSMMMDYDEFRSDLDRTLADPERMAGFRQSEIGPLDDAISELSDWYGFSQDAKRESRRDADPRSFDTPLPAVNPFRGIGRNDPCPCGSGKKFKKCCLSCRTARIAAEFGKNKAPKLDAGVTARVASA